MERLAPLRAVYSDPAWRLPPPEEGTGPEQFAGAKTRERAQIAAMNPRWDAVDIDIEVETLKAWDEATAFGIADVFGADLLPVRPVVPPSLVTLAGPSHLISPADAAELARRGFEVRTVRGAGHTIHRDDFDGFMTSLDGWI
ncbi:hypothetical protein ACIHCQ_18485 [Streptomyces sp. NPDC052236]|uniref:hypothetical protein n=1 Tax=Streptomyces sp. NPDC052236 TaxID=3365686 RepID=UPI0037D948BD